VKGADPYADPHLSIAELAVDLERLGGRGVVTTVLEFDEVASRITDLAALARSLADSVAQMVSISSTCSRGRTIL
jgi:hypothetical protein